MGESEIVFLPAGEYGSVIYPEGRSRASSIAAEVMWDHAEMPYGPPSAFKKGVYGRIVGRHDSPTKTGKPLLTVTTFPYSIKEKGIKGDCSVFVIEADLVQAIEDKELSKALESGEPVEEKPKPKPKTQKELLIEALEAVYPGRYDIQSSSIIIHFPEIEIRNGRSKHQILDLFVRMNLDSSFKILNGTLEGRRTTVTEVELSAHYGHSHLRQDWQWTTFCLGSTPLAMLIGEFRAEGIDPDKFTVLLHWLADYVAWESLDGGPYVRMANLTEHQRILQGSSSTTTYTPRDGIVEDWMKGLVLSFLNKLTGDDLLLVHNSNGTHRWMLDPDRLLRHQQIIAEIYSQYGSLHAYDKIAGVYVQQNAHSSDLGSQRLRFTGMTPMTFRGVKIEQKVIGRTEVEKKKDIIRLPAPDVFQAIIRRAVVLLNRPIEAYYLHPDIKL